MRALTPRPVTPEEIQAAITKARASMLEHELNGEPELASISERAMNRMLDRLAGVRQPIS